MSERGDAPSPLAADLLERVARALHDAPEDRSSLLSFEAAGIDPLTLLAPGDDAFMWTDRVGRITTAYGDAFHQVGSGPGRFAEFADTGRDRARYVSIRAVTGGDPPSPRFVGGGAFVPAYRGDGSHVEFPDAAFAWPRIAWVDDAAYAPRLQISVEPHERSEVAATVARLLTRPVQTAQRPHVIRGDIQADADRERWRDTVEKALETIDRGDASKVVLARRARLRADSVIDAQVLARAMLGVEGTYCYLVRRGDVILAGASPERLVEKRGDRMWTEAVAGTALADDDAMPLEQREKDRREHLAVVLAIEETLAPFALALEHADEPIVRKHGPVAHLVTPFSGRVAPETHVLEIAAALHPTPAVAGTPRDVALDFIARNEDIDRGWYAGPIGWFDLNGDGELAVALRCVRIEGTAVDVFAGAGIVSGSDPDVEFDETVLKMRAALTSLGFELQA